VKGMLPRNKLARHQLGHLKVYAGPDHPHQAQVRAGQKKNGKEEPVAATTGAEADTE
jgi:ribosomal protein L13